MNDPVAFVGEDLLAPALEIEDADSGMIGSSGGAPEEDDAVPVRRPVGCRGAFDDGARLAADEADAIDGLFRSEIPNEGRLDPSGEKRAEPSGPEVNGASPPPTSCLIQMRGVPSRHDVNAMSLPSGEAAGSPSAPE